jgi:glycosyltransferase involved in cell wall biosynthesis
VFGVKRIYFTDQISRPEGLQVSVSPLWKRLLYRAFMAPLTKVVCASCYVYDNLLAKKLFAREQMTVICNAVDTVTVDKGMQFRKSFRTTYAIPEEAFLVVQVGQIVPEKGVKDLLVAARRVIAIDPGVHFLFAGDGSCLTIYRQLVNDWELTDRIIFTGQLADPVGEGVYAAADMVCAVSRWEEAFGLVIAEAMAAAKPLLGTRVGAITEIIEDGVSGFVVERGDTAAMAERILQLAADRKLCETLGQAGRRICEEKFELKHNVRQLLELYGIDSQRFDDRCNFR